ELIKFASENLGMEFSPKTAIGKILAGVRQAWRPDYIILYGERETPVATVDKGADASTVKVNIRALKGGSSEHDPKVRMLLNEAEGAGGQGRSYDEELLGEDEAKAAAPDEAGDVTSNGDGQPHLDLEA
ncbi:MAG: hypothetical protein IID40_09620, partial [Planctomycetes bacterium]|nr:hypothetical protein [Planctomycetota bacterium]